MIPRELVKKLRKIEIYTARLAQEQLVGGYHSAFKGRGMAFSEVRPYAAGDDVRFIDWNVSARLNEPFVKIFTEEREVTVMLLVDLSASGRFGTVGGPKISTVAEIAATLAFSAIKNGDRVGLVLFTDRVERYIPPKRGRSHVMRVVTEILNARPKGRGTDIAGALDFLGHIAHRRTIAFLVSDLIASGSYERPLRTAAARHDLIPIRVTDPSEERLPDVGVALVEGLETDEVVEVDTSDPRVRAAFEARVERERAERQALFRKLRVDSVEVRTDEPYVKPLADLFRMRRRRMAGFR
ncbi:MAG: DUF58 domain-containing protein [Myxococcales bacterium]|nr:DUF58 domain-containing protein [Myxococcales bacterium]